MITGLEFQLAFYHVGTLKIWRNAVLVEVMVLARLTDCTGVLCSLSCEDVSEVYGMWYFICRRVGYLVTYALPVLSLHEYVLFICVDLFQ